MTINYDEVSLIINELRNRAAYYDKQSDIPGYLQKHNEWMSATLYRIAREFNDVLEDCSKTIRVTYDMEGEA